jgi:hypothetical protein
MGEVLPVKVSPKHEGFPFNTGVDVDSLFSTQEERQDVASYPKKSPGIIPLATYTLQPKGLKTGYAYLKTGYAKNELKIENQSNEAEDLSGKQSELQEAVGVGRETESEVASQQRRKEFDPSSTLGDWALPGHGEPYSDCGKKLVMGCLNVEDHHQSRIDGVDVVGRVFVKLKKRACLRPSCPVCYEKWAGRGAHRIEYRLSHWKGSGKPIHLTVSVPHRLYHLPISKLRSRSQKIAREVGFFGGSCIVHPFREICQICGSHKDSLTKRCEKCGSSQFAWYFSPHFHMIGYGWIRGEKVKEVFEKTGWVTVNLLVRNSVGATALYQLSHCGVHAHHDSVSWFGVMARNKMKVPLEVVEKELCPLCGAELVRLLWVGEGDMPYEEEGEYFDKPENWIRGVGIDW